MCPDPDPPPPAAIDVKLLSSTLYHSLHELAGRQLQRERNHSLQPTALVHEAWLRIARLHERHGDQRAQFFALAGKAMRSVIVDHARARLAGKRGGGRRRNQGLDADQFAAAAPLSDADLLALGEALARLEAEEPEAARVVDLMFFCGRTAAETADLLGTSSRTVERRWRFARAWLRDALGDGADVDPAAGT